jgi:hypothetical protein
MRRIHDVRLGLTVPLTAKGCRESASESADVTSEPAVEIVDSSALGVTTGDEGRLVRSEIDNQGDARNIARIFAQFDGHRLAIGRPANDIGAPLGNEREELPLASEIVECGRFYPMAHPDFVRRRHDVEEAVRRGMMGDRGIATQRRGRPWIRSNGSFLPEARSDALGSPHAERGHKQNDDDHDNETSNRGQVLFFHVMAGL